MRGYKKRFEQHLQNKKITLLTSAISCYGPDAFTVRLVEDNISEDMIDDKEKFYIKMRELVIIMETYLCQMI